MLKLSKPRRSEFPKQPKFGSQRPKRLQSGRAPKIRPSLTSLLHHTPMLERIAETAGSAFSITFGGKEVFSTLFFHELTGEIKRIPLRFEECEAELNVVLPAQNDGLARKAFLGEVCLGLSHDFKNVLSGLLFNVQYLSSEESPEEQKRLLEEMQLSIRLAAIICENIQTTNQRRGISLVPLNEIVEVALVLVKPYLRKKDITVENNTSNVTVRVNDADLQLAIMNVLLNAVKHGIAERGTITITCCDTDKSVYLAISNNGIPIPIEIQDSLLKEPVSTNGNGFGLFASARNLKEFGASLSFDSNSQSTSFIFQLPK